MKNFGLLLLRLTMGTLMIGHGTQKLFGWFSGPGLKGTQGFMESLGMKPGRIWGTAAAVGETSGGVLTVLGFLSPLGSLSVAATMATAMRRAHWKNGLWNTNGGVEMPLTNLAAALALAFTGPGRFSVDRALGTSLPAPLAWLAAAATLGTVIVADRKPEMVQQIAETVMPTGFSATDTPDIQRETRPAQEPKPVEAQVS
jgi:putative oxidoreductase